MLTTSRKQIVEQIVEQNGIAFRVFFAISTEFGQRKVEVVKVITLGKVEEIKQVNYIPKEEQQKVYGEALGVFFRDSVASPYSSLIFINGSKPRAPALSK